jgi:hypothetical protein
MELQGKTILGAKPVGIAPEQYNQVMAFQIRTPKPEIRNNPEYQMLQGSKHA